LQGTIKEGTRTLKFTYNKKKLKKNGNKSGYVHDTNAS
tara:strand:+ start:213 stop:326 length:114 start_codon:yes stop_codon:yes gene_type:complete